VLRVFIADDEAPARARLRELMEDIMPEAPTQVVGEARNGVETIERLPQSGADVLLLDIEMPGMHGLEVARHLTRLSDAPAVIFVTAHDRHAVDAFELNALDYLLKPVRSARLAAALKRAAAIGARSVSKIARHRRSASRTTMAAILHSPSLRTDRSSPSAGDADLQVDVVEVGIIHVSSVVTSHSRGQ